MSEILTLARDFIDRMSNPAHGAATNEDYALRFGMLLNSKEFRTELQRELQSTDDAGCLTSFGWLWALEWARVHQLKLKDSLLLHLYQTWASVFVRTIIVDVATQGEQSESATGTVRDFPNPFLRQLMSVVTTPRTELPRREPFPDDDRSSLEDSDSLGLAEDALVALLQVNRPITIAAASALLRHRWDGADRMFDCFRLMLNQQDNETADEWIKRVKPTRPL